MRSTLAALLFVSACAGVAEDSSLPPDANKMRADHAPTPFSADEIREGCPEGRSVKYELALGNGKKQFRVITFTGNSATSAKMESVVLDAAGKPLGTAQVGEASWKDLQSHASFPATQTRITSESRTTPAGTFACWRYDVLVSDDGVSKERRFWFAKDLPGSPLVVEEIAGGQQVMQMTMIRTGK